ncbi:efflux RND transporter periplasmic adaptor subunit [Verrucomicrobiaceae bacterium 5K15]|uniref:Efflux RND transporter periplasmic adaptor subunit n=1 Tax=Oceaniferula flava TaxID=2800421 RepID=A0AAE2SAD9_9BACT|nr:efflux RND transporter periplasmic adaptor subunit [Oceaniferula flavus]MBK1853762.1 efflux RND transporter periplasmic adaptor subunit [Oceaniferula flavus]MBM1135069.1 efflux RND transporter periplasmic adaptor subunit [Oceaniferula flavus]
MFPNTLTTIARSLLASSLLSLPLAAATETDPSDGFLALQPEGIKNLGIQYELVEAKDFERTIFAVGHIREVPQNHSVLSSRIAGRIIEVRVFEGDRVKKGDVLVKVESRQPGSPPPVIELKAPRDGLVLASHIRLGEPVEPEKELLDIVDLTEVWATAQVPEDAVSQIKPGTKAHIRIPALGGEMIDGELLRFDTKADRAGGTIGAIFRVPNQTLRVRPGMRTEFSIVTSTRKNVMAVPREALQGDEANRVVYVKHLDIKNAFTRLPVETGESNDRYVEIVKGLFPGDEVVTKGSYALSFSSGSGISLKEALDAAHGHEHNADGSEMTAEQRTAKEKQSNPNDGSASLSPTVILLACSTGLLLVLLVVTSVRHSIAMKQVLSERESAE